jgi:hypothetical protein
MDSQDGITTSQAEPDSEAVSVEDLLPILEALKRLLKISGTGVESRKNLMIRQIVNMIDFEVNLFKGTNHPDIYLSLTNIEDLISNLINRNKDLAIQLASEDLLKINQKLLALKKNSTT